MEAEVTVARGPQDQALLHEAVLDITLFHPPISPTLPFSSPQCVS